MGIWVLYAYMHLPAWLWTVVIYSQWLYIVLEHSRSLCNRNLNLNHLVGHIVFSNWNFFSQKHLPGVLKRMQFFIFFSEGGGIFWCLGRLTPPPVGRAGSENDTLLPMTMTCDRLKFWSLAWRSKVIIRKPWRRNKKIKKINKKNKFWQNHKAFPAGNA